MVGSRKLRRTKRNCRGEESSSFGLASGSLDPPTSTNEKEEHRRKPSSERYQAPLSTFSPPTRFKLNSFPPSLAMLLPRSLLLPSTSSLLRTARQVPSLFPRRNLSSSELPGIPEPVDLPFELAEPKSRKGVDTLVIAHGLFGSKQNWRSLTRALAQELSMPVYALDLRNHGTAPHTPSHTYMSMASDVSHFFKTHDLTSKQVHLMGHSMGGKVVMATALHPLLNGPIKSLISVDMAPAVGKISPEFASYCDGMLEIENSDAQSKSQADAILEKYEKALSIRQFLLTNSVLKDQKISFRLPLQYLKDAIPAIGDFPFQPGQIHWDGPTLFVKGSRSKYINRHNIPAAESFFPNMKLEELDTSHWVHAEKPAEFIQLVSGFIKST
ncbi:Alpha/Beta hydrolase protein [Mrakia frigida]|uniref:Alpha/Beta hydrolase protein n=1 Tax=Mrakia frigida TaxID=29902 RepID=UPI003FCC02E1